MYHAAGSAVPPCASPFTLDPLEPRVLMAAHVGAGHPEPPAAPAAIIASQRSRDIVSAQDRQRLLDHLTPALRADLQPLLDKGDGAAFDTALLRYSSRSSAPRFFFNPKNLPKYLRFMNRKLPQQVDARLARANDILAHRFPEQVNSSTYDVQLGRKIDWDLQPAANDNPDFLHSLNRHSYWPDLALAYRLTGDPKYVNELIAQLTSWSAQNPNLQSPNDWPKTSPHWWLLDAADRADNWTWSYFLVLGAPGWSAQANTLFLSRIYDHGDFLARATPGSLKANRTTLQATGLLTIAHLFPQFADAPAWQRQGASLMFECLDSQFYADGAHIEETPAYQSATLSALAQNYQLAQLNGQTTWTRKPLRKLTRAIEAYYQLLSPDGTPPGLSDTYRASTALPFLTNASFIFDDDRYRLTTPRLDDVLSIGPDRLQQAAVSVHTYLPDRGTSYALPDAGYFLLRSREIGGLEDAGSATQVVFDAGPKGGTHGHYDLLSFELADSTLHTLIADPGPYRYDDSADRRWAISTPAHNTISVDGLNHAAIEGAHNPAVVVDRFESTADHALITAHHYAYQYLKGSPVVGRTIWLDRGGDNRTPLVLVADYGQSSASHTFTTSFTLPGDRAMSLGGGIVEAPLTHFYTLRLQSIPVTGQTSSLRPTFTSSRPPPNEKDPARRLAISQTSRQAVFVTLISEYITAGEFAQAAPTAVFAAPPVRGVPLMIRISLAWGVRRFVTLDPPPLAPVKLEIAAPPQSGLRRSVARRRFDGDVQTTPP
jgi:hypothetical protein